MSILDSWEHQEHPPGVWKVLQSVIGPFGPLVAEDQLLPVPKDFTYCLTQQSSSQGTWQVSAAKDWQAFAAEQGWGEATQQQQMAYFAQNGACSALASSAQHAQQVSNHYFAQQWGHSSLAGVQQLYAQDQHFQPQVPFGEFCSQGMQQQTPSHPGAPPSGQAGLASISQAAGHMQGTGQVQQRQQFPAQVKLLQPAAAPIIQGTGLGQAGSQAEPTTRPGPWSVMTMLERAGSSIALVFPKQSDASTGKEWVDGGLLPAAKEEDGAEPAQHPAGGRRQPGQSAVAQQASRHGPDQHVSTSNLVTTATGWDVPVKQAAAPAAATAAAACAAAGQAAMAVETNATYAYYGAAEWQTYSQEWLDSATQRVSVP